MQSEPKFFKRSSFVVLLKALIPKHWDVRCGETVKAILLRAWWRSSVILALARLKQEDHYKFETSLGSIVSSRPV